MYKLYKKNNNEFINIYTCFAQINHATSVCFCWLKNAISFCRFFPPIRNAGAYKLCTGLLDCEWAFRERIVANDICESWVNLSEQKIIMENCKIKNTDALCRCSTDAGERRRMRGVHTRMMVI